MSLVSRLSSRFCGSQFWGSRFLTACSSEEEHVSEKRSAGGSKLSGRANQGVAQLARAPARHAGGCGGRTRFPDQLWRLPAGTGTRLEHRRADQLSGYESPTLLQTI